MKRNWRNRLTVVGIFMLLLMAACQNNGEHEAHADTYTCPMHPTVISDRPSTCPVCGMDLVRKARAGEEVEITEALARLIKSPNERVVASIKTITGQYKSAPQSITAQGIVTYDARKIYAVPARIAGRLEKVFLRYPFQPVRAGQKVAEIYSPELLTAQRELLFLLENDAGNEQLISSAKERLRLLGATEGQIVHVVNRHATQSTFAIYSPYNGYAIAQAQDAPTIGLGAATSPATGGGSMGSAMGSSAASGSGAGIPAMPAPTGAKEALVREGSYVSTGETLFRIIDPSALWIELRIPSGTGGDIQKGSKASLDFGNGRRQEATVDFVQPFFNEGQEFLTVRVYVGDTEQLQIGQLVTASLQGPAVEALWVPREAVLNLGVNNVVFIKEKNVLKPKKVTLGARTDNEIEIKQGLSSSDEIAANAQYLVDSESFIKISE